MTKAIAKYGQWGLSVLVGIVMFLFWYVWYPHALSYQEQYQLFLWTGDYFIEKISLPGGFADWAGEFIVQFYYVEWLGAMLLAMVFVALQRLTAILLPKAWCLLSLLPVAVMWWLMGDINVLLSLPMAVILALTLACIRLPKTLSWIDFLILPASYWIIGPVVWLYVIIRVADGVCVAAATVAIAAGNDGTDLLSDSIAASTMEWIR